MAKILALAESGFGKTTSLGGSEEHGIIGANPADSYIITATSKPIPGRGSMKRWASFPDFNLNTQAAQLKDYRRIYARTPAIAAHAITLLGNTPIKNIFLDDTNYFMQDMYMEKALSTGWDAPKKIGFEFNKIFKAMEGLPEDKNFIMLAHGEEYDKADGKKGYRMKTTGKMVQEYITPEGKFDILLIGTSIWNDKEQKSEKRFVTKDDGVFTSAKSHGIFDQTYILNDFNIILKKVNDYYYGE
jgi:hypothetical protein